MRARGGGQSQVVKNVAVVGNKKIPTSYKMFSRSMLNWGTRSWKQLQIHPRKQLKIHQQKQLKIHRNSCGVSKTIKA